MASLHQARRHARLAVVDGRLLIVGGARPDCDGGDDNGCTSGAALDTLEEYDAEADAWRVLEGRLPQATTSFGLAVAHNIAGTEKHVRLPPTIDR